MRGVFRNLSRAGVAKNRSRTSTLVPGAAAAGAGVLLCPASTAISQPLSAPCGARQDTQPADRADRRQRLAAKAQGGDAQADRHRAASRCSGARPPSDSSSGFMPLPSSATAISALAAVVQHDVDARRAGVDRVLDQFLHRRRRALDDLAGGDAVDQDRRQETDRHRPILPDRAARGTDLCALPPGSGPRHARR